MGQPGGARSGAPQGSDARPRRPWPVCSTGPLAPPQAARFLPHDMGAGLRRLPRAAAGSARTRDAGRRSPPDRLSRCVADQRTTHNQCSDGRLRRAEGLRLKDAPKGWQGWQAAGNGQPEADVRPGQTGRRGGAVTEDPVRGSAALRDGSPQTRFRDRDRAVHDGRPCWRVALAPSPGLRSGPQASATREKEGQTRAACTNLRRGYRDHVRRAQVPGEASRCRKRARHPERYRRHPPRSRLLQMVRAAPPERRCSALHTTRPPR